MVSVTGGINLHHLNVYFIYSSAQATDKAANTLHVSRGPNETPVTPIRPSITT